MSFYVQNDTIIEMKLYVQLADQTSINTLGYRGFAQVGLGATDVEVIAALAAVMGGPMKAAIASAATYRGLSIQRVFPLPRSTPTYSVTGSGVGTFTGTVAAKQVAGLIRKVSNVAGRSGEGRWYQPFTTISAYAGNGTPAGPYLSVLAAMAIALQAQRTIVGAGGTISLQPSILHRATPAKVGPPPKPATPFNYIDITGCFEQPFFATQRRRGDYGRKNTPPL